ncbi:MAG: hypothetical protein KAU20_02970 [Nanoarchaeota archaeon]|nr:hypothetical protein [Nanoarchaeota archaeon]
MINLNKFRMGYFLLFKSEGGFFPNQVEKEQLRQGFNKNEACYTHVEVSGGGPYSVSVIAPRTKIVDFRKRHKGRIVRLIRYKNMTYEKKGRYKVAFWAASMCNLKYDFLGIFAFRIRWLFKQNVRLFFCSELALFALQKECKTALGGTAPEHCLPADFARSKDFETVWEGKI